MSADKDPYNKALREKHLRQAQELDAEEFDKAFQVPPIPHIPPAVANDAVWQRSMHEAFKLYMHYTPIAVIRNELGLDADTLNAAIYHKEKGWKAQREKLYAEVKEHVKVKAVKDLRKGTELSLGLINWALEEFKFECLKDKRNPSLEEAVMLTRVFKNLHNAKMDVDVADAEQHRASLKPTDVLKAIANDPYLKRALIAQKDVTELETEAEEIGDTAAEVSDR